MKQSVGIGMNRTGVALHPLASRAMRDDAEDLIKTEPFDGADLQLAREEYASTIKASIGTMPPPGSVKELLSTAVEGLRGQRAVVLMDALGERLGFERTGARLYEALIAKVHALGSFDGGPTMEDLSRIHDEELEHFAMLHRTIEELGGDPTLQTPMADVGGVLSTGLIQVLSDPRTTVPQALHAVHTAELVDDDAWTMLVALAQSMGHEKLAARFTAAEADEARHLDMVRSWLRTAQLSDAHMNLDEVSG